MALIKGDLVQAWTYLSKVQDNPEAYKNLGVYYWLKSDTDKSETYFRKAMNVDGQGEKANANIKMLEKYLKR